MNTGEEFTFNGGLEMRTDHADQSNYVVVNTKHSIGPIRLEVFSNSIRLFNSFFCVYELETDTPSTLIPTLAETESTLSPTETESQATTTVDPSPSQSTLAPTTVITTSPNPSCLEGWIRHGNQCFKPYYYREYFFNAKDICESFSSQVIHSSLAVPHSDEELEYLRSLMRVSTEFGEHYATDVHNLLPSFRQSD